MDKTKTQHEINRIVSWCNKCLEHYSQVIMTDEDWEKLYDAVGTRIMEYRKQEFFQTAKGVYMNFLRQVEKIQRFLTKEESDEENN